MPYISSGQNKVPTAEWKSRLIVAQGILTVFNGSQIGEWHGTPLEVDRVTKSLPCSETLPRFVSGLMSGRDWAACRL